MKGFLPMLFLNKISSFFFMLILTFTSLFGLPLNEYESRQLFNDISFEKGFTVMSQETENGMGIELGNFTYNNNTENPDWMIAQWNSGNCLWENRIDSDKFTITDSHTKNITYNPDDKSVSMRLNAANIYNGEPATYENWPHLLLEQSPICDYFRLSEKDRSYYNCSADRIILSLDIRLEDFKDNKVGIH